MTTETEWMFESTAWDPDGMRVQVTITVPQRAAWKYVGEAGEIAQMTASRALTLATQSRKQSNERPPF